MRIRHAVAVLSLAGAALAPPASAAWTRAGDVIAANHGSFDAAEGPGGRLDLLWTQPSGGAVFRRVDASGALGPLVTVAAGAAPQTRARPRLEAAGQRPRVGALLEYPGGAIGAVLNGVVTGANGPASPRYRTTLLASSDAGATWSPAADLPSLQEVSDAWTDPASGSVIAVGGGTSGPAVTRYPGGAAAAYVGYPCVRNNRPQLVRDGASGRLYAVWANTTGYPSTLACAPWAVIAQEIDPATGAAIGRKLAMPRPLRGLKLRQSCIGRHAGVAGGPGGAYVATVASRWAGPQRPVFHRPDNGHIVVWRIGDAKVTSIPTHRFLDCESDVAIAATRRGGLVVAADAQDHVAVARSASGPRGFVLDRVAWPKSLGRRYPLAPPVADLALTPSGALAAAVPGRNRRTAQNGLWVTRL